MDKQISFKCHLNVIVQKNIYTAKKLQMHKKERERGKFDYAVICNADDF